MASSLGCQPMHMAVPLTAAFLEIDAHRFHRKVTVKALALAKGQMHICRPGCVIRPSRCSTEIQAAAHRQVAGMGCSCCCCRHLTAWSATATAPTGAGNARTAGLCSVAGEAAAAAEAPLAGYAVVRALPGGAGGWLCWQQPHAAAQVLSIHAT